MSLYRTAFLLGLPLLGAFSSLVSASEPDSRVLSGLGAPATSIALSYDGSQVVCSSANGFIQTWMPEEQRFRSFYFPGVEQVTFDTSNAPDFVVDSHRDRVTSVNVPAATKGSLTRAAFTWRLSTRRIEWGYDQKIARDVIDASGRHMARWFFRNAQALDTRHPRPVVKGAAPSLIPTFDSNYFARGLTPFAPIDASSSLRGVAFTRKGKNLVTLSQKLQFWNGRTGKMLRSVSEIPPSLQRSRGTARLYPSPNGRFVAVVFDPAGMDGFGNSGFALRFPYQSRAVEQATTLPKPVLTLALWDERTQTWSSALVEGLPSSQSSFPNGPAISLAWMPDSRSFWAGGGKITRFRADDLAVLRNMRIAGPVAVSGNGKILATRSLVRGRESNGLTLWHIPDDK